MRRDVFQAIADPVRRDILSLVAKNPLTPNALSDSFPVSRQAVSKHLKILTECGLLAVTVQGREYHYSIQPRKLAEVNDWLAPFRQLWTDRLNQLDEVLQTLKPDKP